MSIQRSIYVRYRAEGHVRFAVPERLCQPDAAQRIGQDLMRTQGVYRVDFECRQGKLSIRYREGVTDLRRVAVALHRSVADIPLEPPRAALSVARRENAEAPRTGTIAWAKSKLRRGLGAASGLGRIAAHPGSLLSKDNERFVGEFMTDVLVLYLIKVHWPLILNQWLKRPWVHRYEWLSTLYLIYLLVRSKRPK